MQKAILYLSIALVGVGLMVLVSEYVEPPVANVYKDASAYAEALQVQIDAGDIPEMPTCAKTIELSRTGERIDTIGFLCEDVAARDAYVSFIREEYDWDIATPEDDRIELTRILE